MLIHNSKYTTYAVRDAVQYEVINDERIGFQAATLRQEMRPVIVRRILGTFQTRAEAEKCLDSALASHDSSYATEEKK